jgi:iron complex outermembrane receptor protein
MQNIYVYPGLLSVFTPNLYVLPFKDNNVSPEATLSYHPTNHSTLYAAYKTGYKSGGASLSSTLGPTTTAASLQFGPERVHGFEGGAKGEFLGGRLLVQADVYRYTFNNLQVSALNIETNSFTVRNAAKVRQTGAEVSTTWYVNHQLQLRGALSYNRNRYADFVGQCYAQQTAAQGCINKQQNYAGKPTPRAPDWAGNGGFTYDIPLGSRTLSLTSDTYYSGSYFASETQSPGSKQNAIWRLDASLRLESENDRWELALIGRNLTNKYYLLYAVDKPNTTTGQQYGVVSRPREVMVQATYHFQ